MNTAGSCGPRRGTARALRRIVLWGLLGASLAAGATAAEPGVRITSPVLSGRGWRAEEVTLTRQGDALTLEIGRLALPASLRALGDVRLRCEDLSLDGAGATCTRGRVGFVPPGGGRAGAAVAFEYRIGGTLRLRLDGLDLAGGRSEIDLEEGPGVRRLELQGRGLAAAALGRLVIGAEGLALQGRLDLDLTVQEGAGGDREARLRIGGSGLGFASASGRQAGEGLALRLEGRWRSGGVVGAELELRAGQLYLAPLLLEPDPGATLRLSAAGQFGERRLRLDRLVLDHPGVLSARGRATLRTDGTVSGGVVETLDAHFPGAYRHYLGPVLEAAGGAALEIRGRMRGGGRWAGDALQSLTLSPEALTVSDVAGAFRLENLEGDLGWERSGSERPAWLGWEAGRLYDLDLGAGSLQMRVAGDRLRLGAPARIPVLDGALVVERLDVEGLETSRPVWSLDALVTPISLESLSRGLGWLPLAGKVSGVMPRVRYADGRLEVGGALLVRVFGGEITVTNLALDRPLGPDPRLEADLDLRGLDLLTLTRAFAFGRIEGTLEGRVRGLRLVNWMPVAMSLELGTPANDPAPHRISQRAVENLSALGGADITAVLSRGFMGLFQEFGYRRLGVRGRLEDGVFLMDGVAPAKSGYYLVEGGGLPRIDVIGYTRAVDWSELLLRLQAAARSEGPVVR